MRYCTAQARVELGEGGGWRQLRRVQLEDDNGETGAAMIRKGYLHRYNGDTIMMDLIKAAGDGETHE